MSLLGWLFHSADLAHYREGIARFNAGEYDKAIAALETALSCSENDNSAYHHLERFYAAEAHARFGELLLANGDPVRAGLELEKAIELGQAYPDRLALLARIRHLRGDAAGALPLLAQALVLNPAYRGARAERALCLDELGQHESAWQEIAAIGEQDALPQELCDLAPTGKLPEPMRAWLGHVIEERQEPKRRILFAEACESRGERARAIAELESLARDYPEYPDVRLRLAILLHRSGRLEPARAHLHRAVAINPRYGEAHLHLGILSLKEGHPEEARRHFARAISHQPSHPSLPLLVALAHIRAGAWNEARRIIEQAESGPTNKASALLGLMSWAEGDEDTARDLLLVALEKHPGLGWAARAYAFLARNGDQIDAARRVLEAALKLHPQETALLLALAKVLQKSGRSDLAFAALDMALAGHPQDCVALGWKGRILAEQHAYAEAENCLQRAVRGERAAPDAWQTLGRVLMRQGKLPEAVQALSTALERGMGASQAALDLAVAYFRQARPVEGLRALGRLEPPDANHPLVELLSSPAFVDDL